MGSHFDDLREARRQIGAFSMAIPPIAPQGVYEKLQKFTDKVNNIFGVYMKTISELDTSKEASTQPILDAFKAYEDGEYIMPQKFVRKFLMLQKEIYAEHPGTY
ncbi:stonustoxin subunit alpha [Trichonephila clavata]|uniref:Stonustoxin subunit alpha n=1 Tax=Trichonephila clavata TaxID=2740835 RepID=A0A8X6IBG0_TRICU|nr:stonustoxin subunit alpha [Trichonephila clavata]